MDNETFKKIKKPAASSDAPQLTNTVTAASTDAPKTIKTRDASQDAPKRQPPKAASCDAPKHNTHKRSAASKDAMRMATARNATKQAASRATPTESASKDAPSNLSLPTRPRTVLAHGDSKSTADVDAPVMRAASTAAASEKDLTRLTEALPAGSLNKAEIDLSSLDDAIQFSAKERWITISHKTKPSGKHLAPQDKGENKNVVTDNAGQLAVKPTTSTGAATTVTKRKRSTKPRGRKKHKNTNNVQPARPQKRSRPEDTVTPTGASKKSKPARFHTADGALVSYAEAAATYKNNELCVAVMSEPFQDLTQEQAEEIRSNIENQLRALLMADPEPNETTTNTAIHFRGRAHFAEGVLKTWCEDDFTLSWLKGVINNMASPIPETQLIVRPQSAIPKKALCMLFVPGNTEETQPLLKMLTRQNPILKINTWTLTHVRARQEPPGTFLYFRVSESMVKIIKEQQRRIYYLMGSIYLHFLEKGAASDGSAAPPTSSTSVAPGLEPDSLIPDRSPSSPAAEFVPEEELAISMAAMEVETTQEPTQDPSSLEIIPDEDCFPLGGESGEEDSILGSSPLRDN